MLTTHFFRLVVFFNVLFSMYIRCRNILVIQQALNNLLLVRDTFLDSARVMFELLSNTPDVCFCDPSALWEASPILN